MSPIIPITPVYFIGDSNVLAFRYLLVDAPRSFSRPLVTTACFIPGLSATNVFDKDALHDRVRAFLRFEAIVKPLKARDEGMNVPESAVRRELDATLVPPIQDEWNLPMEPVVVLMLGTNDLLALVSEVGAHTDFFCDDAHYVERAFDGCELTVLPSWMLDGLVESRLAPLARGLEKLKAAGIAHLFLHSLHPPGLDDVAYYRMRGVMCSARLRYKVALAINRAFRRIAEVADIGYLDLWDATTTDGVIDPQFVLDGDHLRRSAASITIEKLLTSLIERRGLPLTENEIAF